MIQRIQTVYFLLGSLAVAAPLYFRTWIHHSDTGNPLVDTGIQVVAGLAALIGLVLIVLHGDRSIQFKVTVVAQVLTLIVIVGILSVLYLSGSFPGVTEVPILSSSAAVAILPVIAYVLFFLARRAVNKDIKLVKSMDRIR